MRFLIVCALICISMPRSIYAYQEPEVLGCFNLLKSIQSHRLGHFGALVEQTGEHQLVVGMLVRKGNEEILLTGPFIGAGHANLNQRALDYFASKSNSDEPIEYLWGGELEFVDLDERASIKRGNLTSGFFKEHELESNFSNSSDQLRRFLQKNMPEHIHPEMKLKEDFEIDQRHLLREMSQFANDMPEPNMRHYILTLINPIVGYVSLFEKPGKEIEVLDAMGSLGPFMKYLTIVQLNFPFKASVQDDLESVTSLISAMNETQSFFLYFDIVKSDWFLEKLIRVKEDVFFDESRVDLFNFKQ